MDCSFTSDRLWFVFDTATGRTLKSGLKTKAAALAWMAAKARPDPIPAPSR